MMMISVVQYFKMLRLEILELKWETDISLKSYQCPWFLLNEQKKT